MNRLQMYHQNKFLKYICSLREYSFDCPFIITGTMIHFFKMVKFIEIRSLASILLLLSCTGVSKHVALVYLRQAFAMDDNFYQRFAINLRNMLLGTKKENQQKRRGFPKKNISLFTLNQIPNHSAPLCTISSSSFQFVNFLLNRHKVSSLQSNTQSIVCICIYVEDLNSIKISLFWNDLVNSLFSLFPFDSPRFYDRRPAQT